MSLKVKFIVYVTIHVSDGYAVKGGTMSEISWYVYQAGQQMGPFSDEQVRQLLNIKMIAQDAFIFKEGWEDWRNISEVFGDSAPSSPALKVSPVPRKGKKAKGGSKKQRMTRVGIKGRVVAHNDGKVVISGGINISASGIFVETKVENTDPSFQVGERIKLTVKADDLSYPFNVTAEMMRFNSDKNHPTGYGMRFIDLPAEIKTDIEGLAGKQEKKLSHG